MRNLPLPIANGMRKVDVIIIEPGMVKTNGGVIAADSVRKDSNEGDYKKAANREIHNSKESKDEILDRI